MSGSQVKRNGLWGLVVRVAAVLLCLAASPPLARLAEAQNPTPQDTVPQDSASQDTLRQDSIPQTDAPRDTTYSSWGDLDATAGGFLVGRAKIGELSIGGYALVRLLNQLAADSFADHLGREHPIHGRRDIQFHRAMVHFKGWLGSPKLRYQLTVWSLLSTDQKVTYGFIGYQANRRFNVYGGINTLGGSRTMFGSHPFWLGHDRVMADEFFRPQFTGTIWINGELFPGFWYHGAVGDNLSILGTTANEDNRQLGGGVSFWWMPTTHEFGPNGSFDDFEWHEKVATRFGASYVRSREDRQTAIEKPTENTQIRLADAVLIWDPGALADSATVQRVTYQLLSADAGMKYHGIFLQGHYFWRLLNDIDATSEIPVSKLIDNGFYLQAAFYPVKQKLELYGATSWVFGDKHAGFRNSYEFLGGMNFYPYYSRNQRVNLQVIHVTRSPVSSLFGYYVGGQTGFIISVATSVYF